MKEPCGCLGAGYVSLTVIVMKNKGKAEKKEGLEMTEEAVVKGKMNEFPKRETIVRRVGPERAKAER